MLNRSVVIVRPKQPYLDWAVGLDDSGIVPNPNDEQAVYLIPSYGDDEEAWEILKRVHPAIFENELYGWHTDEAAWPQGPGPRDVQSVVRDQAALGRRGSLRLRDPR